MEQVAFGDWLVAQKPRHDWVGLLAEQAARDPAFPRTGTPEMIRAHLSRKGASGDMFEMLDDAEAEWLRTVQ